jgi:hypothetical protein
MAAICAGAAAGEAGDRVPQHPARADGTLRGLPVYVRKRDTFTLEIPLILPRFALISAVDLVKRDFLAGPDSRIGRSGVDCVGLMLGHELFSVSAR